MPLFRVRRFRDSPSLQPFIALSTKLKLLAKLPDTMTLSKRLLYDCDTGGGALTSLPEKVLDTVATMKRPSLSAALS